MSEELSPMDRMELWMSAINEAIANGTENTYTPYDRHELWMKKIIESILAKDPADPAVVEEFVNDWLDEHPEATTTVEDGAVTAAKLASNAVETAKIKDGAVTSAKIANNSITEDKLSDGAVVTAKIEDGAVTDEKIASSVAITNAQIDALFA